MATIDTLPTNERVGPRLWLKLVGAAIAVFASFLGVINIASVVGHYGFEWHHVIRQAIEEYRATFYPFYETFLRPLFNWIHIDLSRPMKDAITLLLAAFGAANAESIIRDGRPLLLNVLRTVPFGLEKGGVRGSRIYKEGIVVLSILSGLLLGAVGLIISIYALFFWDLGPLVGFRLSSVPSWFWWWMGLGWSFGAPAGWFFFDGVRKEAEPESEQSRTLSFETRPRRRWGSSLLMATLGLWPWLPFALYLIVAAFACAWIGAVATAIVLSPIAAWRAVTMTTLLFALLFAADLALAHGWL